MNETPIRRTRRRTTMDSMGTVEQAMSTGIVPLTPDTPVGDALVLLEGYGVTCGPVVDGAGRVVGLVGVSDLVSRRELAWSWGPFTQPHGGQVRWCVADVMTPGAVVALPDEPLAGSVVRMDEADVDRMPVVDGDGRPVGLLSRRDVIRAVARWIRGDPPGGQRTGERRPFLLWD